MHLLIFLVQNISRIVIQKAHKDLWNPPLWEIWEYLNQYPKLSEIADIHRGIEWNIPFRKNEKLLISLSPKEGFKKGLVNARGNIESFYAKNFIYLNMDKRFRRTNAHSLPWQKPKIVVNKHIVSRGRWRMIGFVDNNGLVLYQTFICNRKCFLGSC